MRAMTGARGRLMQRLPRWLRLPLRRLRRRWRLATSRFRVLPDFVIVGAQKAGTTSLYAYLVADRHVLPASTKEAHFFDTEKWFLGPEAYRAEFPLQLTMRLTSWLRRHPVITGEATPYYLYHPAVPKRLSATAPDAKIIICLRDPVQRALSHYWHEVRAGRETEPLREALALEESRIQAHRAELARGAREDVYLPHRDASYQDRSRYSGQVARYLQYFPREQILFLKSEELFADDGAAMRELADFLGIPEPTHPFPAENVGRGGNIDAETFRLLEDALREDAEKLTGLVGPKFRWHQRPSPHPRSRVATSAAVADT
jgi:hypothetical protein